MGVNRRPAARPAQARRAVFLKVQYLRELERRSEYWVSCRVLDALLRTAGARAKLVAAERRLLQLLMDRRDHRKKKKAAR